MPTRKKKVAPSIVGGFILAFLEMGLPMIGITVNLFLGAFLFVAAFVLFAWGLWNWETNHKYSQKARVITLVIVGMFYFGLVGLQINSQYKKNHESSQEKGKDGCSGDTGPAIATGTGNIANSGNCVDSKSAGQPPPKSNP